MKTPEIQAARQGALVTQEWTRGEPLEAGHYFAGEDVPPDASVHGLVMFLFACFGGGCPDTDSYYYAPDGSRLPLAPQPLIARLPQALLSRGALAVIAHIDRAFSYAFEDVMGTPQAQLLRTPLELLMKGRRVGLATDPLNLQWSSLAAQLGIALGGNAQGRRRLDRRFSRISTSRGTMHGTTWCSGIPLREYESKPSSRRVREVSCSVPLAADPER